MPDSVGDSVRLKIGQCIIHTEKGDSCADINGVRLPLVGDW